MITLEQAKRLLLKRCPDRKIEGSTEEGGLYLFLAPSSDSLEGHLDPFLSVDKRTGYLRDFSPVDYDNSRDILDRLQR